MLMDLSFNERDAEIAIFMFFEKADRFAAGSGPTSDAPLRPPPTPGAAGYPPPAAPPKSAPVSAEIYVGLNFWVIT